MARTRLSQRDRDRRRHELELIILADLITAFAWVLATFGANQHAHLALSLPIVGILVLPFVPHITNRFLAPSADAIIVPAVAFLNGLGYVVINSLDPREGSLQVLWTAVSVVAYAVTLFFVKNPESLDKYRYLLAIAGIGFLFLPVLPGIGLDLGGERLWVHLGTITFQPVEIAKLILAIFLSSLIIERRELLSKLRGLGWRRIGPIAVAFAVALGIMAIERDVGFALLIFCTFTVVMWAGTSNRVYLLLGLAFFIIGAFLVGAFLPVVHERIVVWLDPWKYSHTIGYQIVQSQYALGAGGLVGTGLGLGHIYVPVATSDFIFAEIGEQMGLFGTTAILMAFILILGSGIRIALRAKSEFSSLLAMAFTVILGLETLFILAGIARLLPLTGVSLPFVAYGGSSLLANYILIAILIRISHRANYQIDSAPGPELTAPPAARTT